MTSLSIPELVRRDLLWREQQSSSSAYTGRAAILDAYEEALDLTIYLRQVIEELTISGQLYPTPAEGTA